MGISSVRKLPVAGRLRAVVAAFAAAAFFLGSFPSGALAQQKLAEQFRLVGRFVQPSPSAAIFAWPGSAIEIAFTGSRLDISLRDTGQNSMVVELDGKPSRLDLRQGKHDYRVVDGAPHGPHLLRLIRRTEPMFGPTVFMGAETDGSFARPHEKEKSLFVIGDSISAGYGVEGETTSCKFSADTENQYLTYAALVARAFEADVITAAVSGKGLVRNYDGGAKNTMPEIYLRGLPDRPGDLPFPRSDVIIVHLGTNDFGNGARPPGFEERYAAFLEELRKKAPDAMIYAAMGPLLFGEDLKAAAGAVKRAVEARAGAGDDKLSFIAFEDPEGREVRGCDWHPNAAGQEHMADILGARLEADLGWERRE
jgi:lysophospholipase L1-like esterase|uniref:Lipolytic enzyme, G-D-S-L n=2 Tax=Phyllobacteriaceae TaxID=69277 RepID=Q11JW6_CHESB|nr:MULTISPECIES: SGNH/GDSL hydrolase family protein [Chelativorans]